VGGGGSNDYKGPQVVPTHPPGKGRLSVCQIFGSGECNMSGAKREVELGPTALVRNFELCC
jgi:hypothetical protein